jgi:geranylgeranyl pyrophosphate synthase
MAEAEVTEIGCTGGRVTGVRVRQGAHSETIAGDYYVCALPVERFAPLVSPGLLRADPGLEGIPRLVSECLEWMNGVQFYCRRPLRLVRGHMNHIDTEWALTSISQVAVWKADAMLRYGPGDIQGIVSVDVSDWDALAPDGRSATNRSREEVCKEVWRQLKRSVNTGEEEILRDEDLVGWFIDSDIDRDPSDSTKLANAEPLLVNLVDSWRLRPEAITAIPNFFLAADYVRTHTDLATMEAANEAARRAVNGILDAEGYAGSRCQVWPLHEPATLAPFRQYDAVRFGLGLPWDSGLANVASAAVEAADPMLAPVAKLIATIEPVVLKVQKGLDAVDSALPLEEVDSVLQPLVRGVQEQVEKLEASVSGAEMEEVATQVARSFASAGRAEGNRPSVGVDSEAEMGPVGFGERLDWYRSLAAGALRGAVPPSEPQQFLYEPIREFIARPAKGLRPALCIATCRAFGGRTADALSSAAGIELLHNAFLVHDDIEDGSEFRRGGPTLHRTLGVPLAVNIGDAMNALSMRLFRENLSRLDPTASLRIFDEVDHMLAESLEGQALELSWIRENNCRVTTDDYLRLVLKKTAWYSFIHPMRIGAIAARPQDDELARFHAFGFLLGAAFQIQDDVLNLVGEEDRYGKEIGGDLWEGKRTLPLIHAFSHASAPGRARLKDFLARPREGRLPRQLFELNQVLQEGGSIEWARRVASALTVAARDALPMAYAGANESPDLEFVRSLVDYLVARDV